MRLASAGIISLVLSASCAPAPRPQPHAGHAPQAHDSGKDSDSSGQTPDVDNHEGKTGSESNSGSQGSDPGQDQNMGNTDEGSQTQEMPIPKLPLAPPATLKVLSLNVWEGGPQDLARDIKQSGADIACLQEVTPAEVKAAATGLGAGWKVVHTGNPDVGYALISRLPVIRPLGETASARAGLGALFQVVPGVRAIFFCHHANAYPYGPYLLGLNKRPVAEVLETERKERGLAMTELLAHLKRWIGGVDSVFLAGDFNAPSHLDYSPAFAWPISTAVHAEGFVDSYAQTHPQNAKKTACKFGQNDPGITWARLASKEPDGCFDRIDFIYYASSAAKALESKTLDLALSDHRAVLSTFQITDMAIGSQPSKPSPRTAATNVVRRPILSWVKTENAGKYTLYLGKDAALSAAPVSLKDNFYEAPLLDAGASYSWRVDATDANGMVTKGATWSFTTAAGLGITAAKAVYSPGEAIVITFDGGSDAKDWIGLFGQGTAGSPSWKYLNDSLNPPAQAIGKGQVTLQAPAVPGTYIIKGLLKGGYKDVDSLEVTVR